MKPGIRGWRLSVGVTSAGHWEYLIEQVSFGYLATVICGESFKTRGEAESAGFFRLEFEQQHFNSLGIHIKGGHS